MPFGQTNAPIVFMDLMNQMFQPYLDQFTIAFVHDILIYSRSRVDSEAHLRITLQTLQEHRLYTKLSKCEFCPSKVVYLGHVMSGLGIVVDLGKVEVVLRSKCRTTAMEIQSFLCLAGYYKRFIQGFSSIVVLLTQLTRKGERFVQTEACEQSL